jgi:hypothetical protein
MMLLLDAELVTAITQNLQDVRTNCHAAPTTGGFHFQALMPLVWNTSATTIALEAVEATYTDWPKAKTHEYRFHMY